MPETLTVKQDMKPLEFLNAVYFQTSRMKLIKRLFFLSIILGVLNASLDILSPVGGNVIWYQIVIDFFIAPVFIVLFFFVFITVGAILLMLLRRNHFTNVTYNFTHWGMEKIGKGIEFTRPWNKFLKFRETKHFIFLYITPNDAHIIQKRMFINNEEIEDLRKLISAQVPGT